MTEPTDARAKFAHVEGSMSEALMAERRAEAAQDAEYVRVLRDLRDAYADHLDRWCAGQGAGTRHLPIIKADELLAQIDGEAS